MGKILRLLAVFYYMVSSCSVFTPSLQKSEHGHALTGPPVVFAETDWELIDWRHVKCWVRPGQDAACIGNCWNPRVVADASMCCMYLRFVFVLMLTNSSVLQICNVHELNYDQGQWDVSNIVLLQIQDAKYQVRCISKDKACLLVIPVGI